MEIGRSRTFFFGGFFVLTDQFIELADHLGILLFGPLAVEPNDFLHQENFSVATILEVRRNVASAQRTVRKSLVDRIALVCPCPKALFMKDVITCRNQRLTGLLDGVHADGAIGRSTHTESC